MPQRVTVSKIGSVLHMKTTECDLSIYCHLGNIDRQRREEKQTARHARSSGGHSEEKYFHNCLKFYTLGRLQTFPSIEKKEHLYCISCVL